MPWSISDVDSHKKGLTDKQKRAWVHIANAALRKCKKDGGSDCDASAIRQANAAATRVSESGAGSISDLLLEAASGYLPDSADGERFAEAALAISTSFEGIRQKVAEAVYSRYRQTDLWPYVQHVWDDKAVYCIGDKCYEVGYTVSGDDVSLDEPVEVEMVYQQVTEAADVSIIGDLVAIKESKGSKTFPVTLIRAGQGDSAYYPAGVLKRDGPKAFKAGTQMYWDHPTEAEEADRPEGSLRNLVGKLTKDATWDEATQSLVSEAMVYDPRYVDTVKTLAVHDNSFGVSIRALGKKKLSQVNGKPTEVMESRAKAISVDFVTRVGAGGKVHAKFTEAARLHPVDNSQGEQKMEVDEKELNLLRESSTKTQAALSRTTERLVRSEAISIAKDLVRESDALTDPAKDRVIAQVRESVSFPTTSEGDLDTDKLKESVTKLIESEAKYVATLTGGGKVKGMGEAPATLPPDEALTKTYESAKASLDQNLKKLVGR
jgi:hypothetical protein